MDLEEGPVFAGELSAGCTELGNAGDDREADQQNCFQECEGVLTCLHRA